ncbi:MAG: hypothetical protein LBT92_04060 [Rickettsiales bacterium]|jgi:hypothetical protein|nr:hypothetical protein [Rickettsiales bacterium]
MAKIAKRTRKPAGRPAPRAGVRPAVSARPAAAGGRAASRFDPFVRFTAKEWGVGLLVILAVIGLVFIISTFGMMSCRAARVEGVVAPNMCFAFLKFTMLSGKVLFTGGETLPYVSVLSVYLALYAIKLVSDFVRRR